MPETTTMTRIAVVGAGPAGFFATAELLKKPGFHVDLFDRLPTPYGLVRHGVAPDHQKIKSITARYARDAEAAGPRLRLFGNVEIGRDLSVEELRERYHAIVFAFGAQSNRRLGVPGEELRGVHPASVFVAWYNGHPDCANAHFDLQVERAIVVGVGNVAIDVARMLSKPYAELVKTDIADHALEHLSQRNTLREVVVLGRQSAAQASFTPVELEELTKIPGCDLVVAPEDRRIDAASEAARAAGKLEPRVKRNLEIIESKALTEPVPGRRAIRLRFYSAPAEVLGDERVEALRIERTRHVEGEDGTLRLERTGQTEDLAAGIVFRSVGYKVAPFPGVPFDDKTSSVPHDKGQVLASVEGEPVRGLFVTGWAKRGPTGVIGTNKPDAAETVATLLAAAERGELPAPALSGEEADVVGLLEARQVQYVSYSDWKLLDQIEVESGREQGRPRRKFTEVSAMLEAIGRTKMGGLEGERLVAADT
jgi:ferredoxin--NADP+ reductase